MFYLSSLVSHRTPPQPSPSVSLFHKHPRHLLKYSLHQEYIAHPTTTVFAFQSFSLMSKPYKDILPDETLDIFLFICDISSSEPPSQLARNSLVTLHLLAHDPRKIIRDLI